MNSPSIFSALCLLPLTVQAGGSTPASASVAQEPAALAAPTSAPLAPSAVTDDDWTPGVYMSQALVEVAASARVLMNETSFGLDEDICLAATFLRKGQTYSFSKRLDASTAYTFIAGGDDDCRDIDIAVLDGDGDILASDVSTDRMAALQWTPRASGYYTIRVKLYDAPVSSFVAMAFLKDGGYDVPERNLTDSLGSFMRMCEVSSMFRSAAFLSESNQAAVWCTLLDREASSTITNIRLGTKPVRIMATADGQASDIDLRLLSSQDGVLAKDIAKDSTPIVSYTPRRGQSYKIKVSHYGSGGRMTFCTFGVLRDV